MTFEIELLPRAEADVQKIVQFLVERSPQGAEAWWQRWEQAVDELRPGRFNSALLLSRRSTTSISASCSSKRAAGELTAHCSPSSAEVCGS